MSKTSKKQSNSTDNIKKITKKPTVIKVLKRKIQEYSNGIKTDSHGFKDTASNILEQVRTDVVLRSALGIKYSTIRTAGYYWTGKVTQQKLNRLKDLRFNRWYGKQWWQTLMYKNVFSELSRDSSNSVTKLGIVKTDTMEIVNDDRGNIAGYLQVVDNPESKVQRVEFSKENIVHFAYDTIGNSLWGESEITVLGRVLYNKALAEGFLSWLLESNQFRSVIKIPDSINEDDIENYLQMLKGGMIDRTNFLVIQGDEAEVKQLREIEGFKEILDYIHAMRMEALSVLQVPPLLVGITDNSNRSSSEYQIRYNFYTHIYSLFRESEDEINNELLPALGIKDMELKHGIIDAQGKKDVLEIAQKLASIGANVKKLNKWLVENGMDIPTDLLEELDVMEDQASPGLKLDKNDNQQPSRKATEQDFAGGSRTK